jgi:hypothetical protein
MLVRYRGRDDRKRKAAENRLTVAFENPTVSSMGRLGCVTYEVNLRSTRTATMKPSKILCMKPVCFAALLIVMYQLNYLYSR